MKKCEDPGFLVFVRVSLGGKKYFSLTRGPLHKDGSEEVGLLSLPCLRGGPTPPDRQTSVWWDLRGSQQSSTFVRVVPPRRATLYSPCRRPVYLW